MGKSERTIKTLNSVRWLGIMPALIIYAACAGVFAPWLTAVLTVGFWAGFAFICTSEKKRILCADIVKDITGALARAGHKDAVFEIKPLKIGIVIRVYLIRARHKSMLCSEAITSSITSGWYRHYVRAMQIVDLDSEADVSEAQMMFNEDLWADIREKAGRGRNDGRK